ncbi:hypothetical protein FFLO_00661 [Filobasidium floriforme]|uniref:Macrophage erythroblast attacher n=1 Tax=Filobasidium floriforme TaxID=5210 RepID=A0A8K0NT90_9TREE|nr:hypothetical protein FFLO_00661 [Filobasidium floriforme]
MLEEPTIRIPYELMRRNHRAAQRQVERDFTGVQSSLKTLLKTKEKRSGEEVLNTIQAAKDRITGLKRKLEQLQPSASSSSIGSSSSNLKSRLQILKDMQELETAPIFDDHPGYRKFTETRLDRLITEYLLRTGKRETASTWAREQGIEAYVDIPLYAECARIESALVDKKSCSEALAWCGENRGTLRKTKNDLEFHLRRQEYVELCRSGKRNEALAYARKHLASQWAETHFQEITGMMGLLAFPSWTTVTMYQAMFSDERWEGLRSQFKDTFFSVYGITSLPLLSLAVSAGLSTLKLSACLPNAPHATPFQPSEIPPQDPNTAMVLSIPSLAAAPPVHVMDSTTIDPALPMMTDPTPLHDHPEHPQRNIDCPTCAKDLSILAREVPFSHHVNSTLVCRISGEVMDDTNYPMAFPNGYVYSYNALRAMAKEHNGVFVTCPRTGEQCSFSRLRKVFIT